MARQPHHTQFQPTAILRWAPAVIVALCLAAAYGLGLHRYFSLDDLGHYRDALAGFVDTNAPLAALVYVLVYVAAVAISFPGASALTAAGGLMFGCIAGTILAVFAATFGGTVI